MQFASVRLITADLQAVVAFYETVTQHRARWFTDDFAELAISGCTLALASERTMRQFGADAAQPAQNRSAIVEFRVEDVDAAFARLEGGSHIVQRPTTMPWGNRSLLVRDPEGTLVNLFTPVTPAAKQRYGL